MNDQNQTISIPFYHATDATTGIITAFYADDYSTVTQGTDMDQVGRRLLGVRNLMLKAREKYGFAPVSSTQPIGKDFKLSNLTYQVVA